ncbi:hypothetical protein H9P43_003077 [Blastocladiella emersonii ATCC 22665]|nr:hypothetical protein H9P43_003077 [Blastocladiella emersonii ATCC 22665]
MSSTGSSSSGSQAHSDALFGFAAGGDHGSEPAMSVTSNRSDSINGTIIITLPVANDGITELATAELVATGDVALDEEAQQEAIELYLADQARHAATEAGLYELDEQTWVTITTAAGCPALNVQVSVAVNLLETYPNSFDHLVRKSNLARDLVLHGAPIDALPSLIATPPAEINAESVAWAITEIRAAKADAPDAVDDAREALLKSESRVERLHGQVMEMTERHGKQLAAAEAGRRELVDQMAVLEYERDEARDEAKKHLRGQLKAEGAMEYLESQNAAMRAEHDRNVSAQNLQNAREVTNAGRPPGFAFGGSFASGGGNVRLSFGQPRGSAYSSSASSTAGSVASRRPKLVPRGSASTGSARTPVGASLGGGGDMAAAMLQVQKYHDCKGEVPSAEPPVFSTWDGQVGRSAREWMRAARVAAAGKHLDDLLIMTPMEWMEKHPNFPGSSTAKIERASTNLRDALAIALPTLGGQGVLCEHHQWACELWCRIHDDCARPTSKEAKDRLREMYGFKPKQFQSQIDYLEQLQKKWNEYEEICYALSSIKPVMRADMNDHLIAFIGDGMGRLLPMFATSLVNLFPGQDVGTLMPNVLFTTARKMIEQDHPEDAKARPKHLWRSMRLGQNASGAGLKRVNDGDDSNLQCKRCDARGHTAANCRTKFPKADHHRSDRGGRGGRRGNGRGRGNGCGGGSGSSRGGHGGSGGSKDASGGSGGASSGSANPSSTSSTSPAGGIVAAALNDAPRDQMTANHLEDADDAHDGLQKIYLDSCASFSITGNLGHVHDPQPIAGGSVLKTYDGEGHNFTHKGSICDDEAHCYTQTVLGAYKITLADHVDTDVLPVRTVCVRNLSASASRAAVEKAIWEKVGMCEIHFPQAQTRTVAVLFFPEPGL